jgi:hypothetical protein
MSQDEQKQSTNTGEWLENGTVQVYFDEHNVLILRDSARQEEVRLSASAVYELLQYLHQYRDLLYTSAHAADHYRAVPKWLRDLSDSRQEERSDLGRET